MVDTDEYENSNSWTAIDQAIKEYTVINPNEIQLQMVSNAQKRHDNLTEWGSGKTKAMRQGVSIPVALLFKLERIMPDLFKDRKLTREFMKRYKGFRTCETV